jgi:RNA polymerase sigma-70 factor (ECF subfamily)
MASGRVQTLPRDLEAIFGGGSGVAVSDGRLLERFLAPRDETGERAFETLVHRHGPMVFRVCRQVLGNGHDAEDAFQAVFMVLARRAGGIRSRESVGSWLYGVTLRVAGRVRQGARHHQSRQQPADDGLKDIPSPAAEPEGCSQADTEAVHQEVARLAEKYRAPIVLCYLEGLTHDQAAERLSWPVGTVRSRLARARDQLRGRLARRGVTAPAALGPVAGWSLTGAATSADAAAIPGVSLAVVPADLLSSTVRAACAFVQGKTPALALVSMSSLILTKGALRSMALEKLTLAAAILFPAGALTVVAGTMFGQDSVPRDGQGAATIAGREPKRADPTKTAASKSGQAPIEEPGPDDRAEQIKAAQQEFQADWKHHREGEIGVEQLLRSASRLYNSEASGAQPSKLVEIAQRHLARIKEIEDFEQAEVKAGRATEQALNEVHRQLEEVRMGLHLARDFKQPKLADLVEAARQRLLAQRAYYEEGRITIDRFIAASQRLMEAERSAARTDAERLAALKRHVDILKEVENRERAELVVGKGTEGDLAEAVQSRVEAEIQLGEAASAKPSAEIEALKRRLGDVERKLDQLLKQQGGGPRP